MIADDHAEGWMFSLFLKLAENIRQPIVFAIFIAMFVTVCWLSYDHVSKEDFRSVQEELKGLQYTLTHGHLDTRLNTVEDKEFELTQRMAEGVKNPEVDRINRERMEELKRQEENLRHDLALLEHQGKMDLQQSYSQP